MERYRKRGKGNHKIRDSNERKEPQDNRERGEKIKVEGEIKRRIVGDETGRVDAGKYEEDKRGKQAKGRDKGRANKGRDRSKRLQRKGREGMEEGKCVKSVLGRRWRGSNGKKGEER